MGTLGSALLRRLAKDELVGAMDTSPAAGRLGSLISTVPMSRVCPKSSNILMVL